MSRHRKISSALRTDSSLQILSLSLSVKTTVKPGIIILQDHDEYLDHLLQVNTSGPVAIIKSELPGQFLFSRSRSLNEMRNVREGVKKQFMDFSFLSLKVPASERSFSLLEKKLWKSTIKIYIYSAIVVVLGVGV